MNSLIETLNSWGGNFLHGAWPMLWQSSLLIGAVLAFDFVLRHQLRVSIRYALWLVVLVKLILPPTLALPTSPAWWLHKMPPPLEVKVAAKKFTITYDQTPLPEMPQTPLPIFVPPPPKLTLAAWLLMVSACVSTALFIWLLARWWQITRQVRRAEISERLTAIASETQLLAKTRFQPRVKLTANTISPAVCGLFRPVILIPQTLAENFSDEQLRAVLLHELIHLQRRDVWVNFLQSLLQIFYWWHPLVWLANARIRHVREEAVDDAVMLALRDDAETYAPTLLEVAKLALNRPLASLGLMGILESRSALRQRIERLVNFSAPRKAGLTIVSFLGILVFSAVAVPMGGAPNSTDEQTSTLPTNKITTTVTPITNRPSILVEARFYQMPTEGFQNLVSGLQFNEGRADENPWWSASSEKFSELRTNLENSGFTLLQRPRVQTFSGIPAELYIGNGTNGMEFDCTPVADGKLIKLAVHGEVIDGGQNEISTNHFLANASMENLGGMVIRMERMDGLTATNLVAVIGVQILTNDMPVHSAQRLEAIVNANNSSPVSATDATGVLSNPNFDTALRALKQRTEAETLTAPKAEVQAGQVGIVNVVNELDPSTGMPIEEKLATNEPQNNPAPNRFTRTFKLDYPTDGDSLKKLFLAAGVQMPPTFFFYTDNGILLATGTKEQLARVYRVVLKLNGEVSPQEIEDVVNQSVKEPTVGAGANLAATNQLFMRTFKLNDACLAQLNLNSEKTVTPTNDGPYAVSYSASREISVAFRSLFTKLGVDLESPKGKAVFYNDRLGLLFVKATEDDLNTIDRAIQALNQVAPQIHIKARFLEVAKGTWDGMTKMIVITNRLPQLNSNQITGIIGILTAENFQPALRSLQARAGVEELAEPEGVTTTGRQMQMRGTTIITVLTNFIFQETITNFNFATRTSMTNSSITPQTGQAETGPILDAIPYILSDDYTINLTAIASLTEFMGYDNSTNTEAAYTSAGEKVDVPTVSPSFRIRQAVASVNLWDGQTLVMKGLLPSHAQSLNEKHPDVPLLGRLYSSKSKVEPEKELVVFVTVTIVDPAGNRVHSDEELPFAQISIPPQPPQSN